MMVYFSNLILDQKPLARLWKQLRAEERFFVVDGSHAR
jgi:hypothetical protein